MSISLFLFNYWQQAYGMHWDATQEIRWKVTCNTEAIIMVPTSYMILVYTYDDHVMKPNSLSDEYASYYYRPWGNH